MSAPYDHPKGASALVSALIAPVQLNLRASLMEDDGKRWISRHFSAYPKRQHYNSPEKLTWMGNTLQPLP